MKKIKLVAAALAVVMTVGMLPTSASAGYFNPYFFYFKHFKHFKHIKHVKHVKGGGGGGSSSAPWIIIGCAGGVVLAALAANYRDGRELTAPEAWSCGTLFLFSAPRYYNP